MKKVSIVLLLVVCMVLSMTGCGFTPIEVCEVTPAEEIEIGKLKFDANGTYNTPKEETEIEVYRFNAPNDNIVVYQMPGPIYLIGEVAEKSGTKYMTMYIEDSEFVALSNQYVLLTVGEDMVAYSIKENEDTHYCGGLLTEYSFEDLPEKEKEAFVYPAV